MCSILGYREFKAFDIPEGDNESKNCVSLEWVLTSSHRELKHSIYPEAITNLKLCEPETSPKILLQHKFNHKHEEHNW